MEMICREIFEAVCAMIGEDADDLASEPIRRRLPSLLNAAVLELSSFDRTYRERVLGEDTSGLAYPSVSGLDDPFPLCGRMMPLVCYYCAALAVRDENAILSDFMADHFVRACKKAAEEIPAVVHRIRDVY